MNLFDLLLDPAAVIPPLRVGVTVVYAALLIGTCLVGLHRYRLVWLFRKHRRRHVRPRARFTDLPAVTVQLPIYNEPAVAERVIDTVCSLDYPADRLQVQVLDDSTDGTAAATLARVRYWQARGVRIEHHARTSREGFKAGALAAALPRATGELIAIFDADFVPPAHFLRRTVHHFTDPGVGMVQARWTYLNREDSLLTRAQAVFLDGHFVVEHTARNRGGAWMNFNGTAGTWRRAAIETAGGWHGDTLTEDVDLSYRAQLAGWRFVYLPTLTCPGELPPEPNAFKTQQHRWSKGSLQVARKLLPTILRSDESLRVKVEACFHLLGPLVNLFITLLVLLFYPVIALQAGGLGVDGTWLAIPLGVGLLGLGVASAITFYTVSQTAQRRSVGGTLVQAPVLIALGVAVALSNTIACIEALARHRSAFVRTPKYGRGARDRRRRISSRAVITAVAELALAIYMLACLQLALREGMTLLTAPFLALFMLGYCGLGAASLWPVVRPLRWARESDPAPAGAA